MRHRTDVVWPTATRRKKCRVSGDLASAGLAGASEDPLLHRGFSGDAARDLWEGGSPTVGRRALSAGKLSW